MCSSDLYDMLTCLSKLRYVSYIPAKKTPFIFYTTSREENQFVFIPRSVYEDRKKRFEKRIFSMIEYAENKEICRSRVLLNYFGEKNAKDCGRCDICLKKNESGLSNYEFRLIESELKDVFQERDSFRLKELVDMLSESDVIYTEKSEKVIKVIRFKIDLGEFKLKDDNVTIK